jgi:hypothetical protein
VEHLSSLRIQKFVRKCNQLEKISIVNNGNKPDKKSYKFTGNFKEEANMCTIRTICGKKLNILFMIPPIRVFRMNETHKNVTHPFFKAYLSIDKLFKDCYLGRSRCIVKFCSNCKSG